MNYNEVVAYLENLIIMPKTMPGLEKIRAAVMQKPWFKHLDPKKIITIAGTNGKGTTAAALEALLIHADQKVGLYTSPHLVTTTERIRVNGQNISENNFTELFKANQDIIERCQLSHFEALTLMAAEYFYQTHVDYMIFEVGLGGTFDATNIFPNHYSVITKIGLDHENILGSTLSEIAKNKFGIIKKNTVVIHHQLHTSLEELKSQKSQETDSTWIPAETWQCSYQNNQWHGSLGPETFTTNLVGPRAIENIATALTAFKHLGFEGKSHFKALEKINWPGRMQKVNWPGLDIPVYLSGDHNPQGIESLLEILKHYQYNVLHLVVGIGTDKSCDEMLNQLSRLPRVQIYLTETPFKGRKLNDYPAQYKAMAVQSDVEVQTVLSRINVDKNDMILVTGSLYLIGKVLKTLTL